MDIKEIREKARLTDEFSLDDYLDEMGWVMRKDITCHTYAWLKQLVSRVADAQITKYNNTEIVSAGEGRNFISCPECKGTGKLKPITVEQAIKEKME